MITLALGGVTLPPALAGPLTQLRPATPTLAFLTIGLGLASAAAVVTTVVALATLPVTLACLRALAL